MMLPLKTIMQKLQLLSKMMIAVLVLVFNINTAISQINLVANPSFEIISSCPNNYYQLDSAIGWSTLMNGGGGSPDLFHVCCTLPVFCGVPQNTGNYSFQYPHSGNAYCDIQVVGSSQNDYREYIQSKLIKGLSENHTYCFKFYTSLTDNSHAYITPLGAYFDDGSVSAPTFYGLAAVTPQVYNTIQLLNDTVNWMKIEGSFVATGIEEYITIGNFFPDSSSDIGFFGAPTIWASYYYIDDVSLIDAGLPAFAGNDTVILPGDSVFIGRQPEVGLNEDCIWFVDGAPIDTVAGMWVKPDSTTSYVLEQTICGNVSYDTVTVIVSGVGIEQYTNGKGIKIFPNPTTGDFWVQFDMKLKGKKANIRIYSMIGEMVYNEDICIGNVNKIMPDLNNGAYFITIKTDDASIKNYNAKITVIK